MYMKKIFFTLLVFSFSKTFFCQESIRLVCTDSFAFDTIKGYPVRQGDSYFFYNRASGDLNVYSNQENNPVTTFTFDSLRDHRQRYYHYGDVAYRLSDRYMLIRHSGSHFDFFDLTGKYLHSKKIDQTFQGQKRYINDDYSPKNALVSRDGNSFFLRVANWPTKPKGEENYVIRQRKNLKTVGIVAQFNLDGEIIGIFGQYDPVYWDNERITDFDKYSISISSTDEVYLSFEISDKVSVYSGGKFIRYVGQRGEHINKDISEVKFSTSKQEWFFNLTTSYIETPLYFDCQIVNDRYLVRTYAAALTDTVQFTSQELETRRKWASGELKACRLKTKNDEAQLRLCRSKPCYVQIFDLQAGDKCLYDGPIEVRFPICLGMRNDNAFIFTSHLKPEKEYPQKQVLYYYQLKPYKDTR